MKKSFASRFYFFIGITAFVSVQSLRSFADLPDFYHGFGIGLAIAMFLASLCYQYGNFEKLRAFKRKLIFRK